LKKEIEIVTETRNGDNNNMNVKVRKQ